MKMRKNEPPLLIAPVRPDQANIVPDSSPFAALIETLVTAFSKSAIDTISLFSLIANIPASVQIAFMSAPVEPSAFTATHLG